MHRGPECCLEELQKCISNLFIPQKCNPSLLDSFFTATTECKMQSCPHKIYALKRAFQCLCMNGKFSLLLHIPTDPLTGLLLGLSEGTDSH